MGLTNSQYNAVMREYEQRQLNGRHEREERVARVYDRLPRVRELDQEMSSLAAACARLRLAGREQELAEGKARLARLRQEKKERMREGGFPEDYMEMRYVCPDCKDTGYADGKRCHCFERARLRLLYAQSNIEEILKRENFSTLSFAYYDDQEVLPQLGVTEAAYMKLVVRRCQEFAREFPEKGGNLLFTGSTGVGKTFLTNCIARELIDQGVSVIYFQSQDLFELFSRSKFGREGQEEAEENCRQILDCQLLIIDDLGTELNNSFVSSQLFYCINERMNMSRSTIISTNLTLARLRDSYTDRVTSRIMSGYKIIPLYGGDIRLLKK